MSEPVANVSRPPRRPILRSLVGLAAVAGLGAAAFATRDRWRPALFPVAQDVAPDPDGHTDAEPAEQVTLSPQARKNLRLTSRPLKPETFWKTISVPGLVIDRPGCGDHGVAATAAGVVGRIHKVAGDTARPGDVLFTLKLVGESLHQTQTDLFKAAQDIKLAEAQKKRLAASAAAGAVAETHVIEIDNQITRLGVATKAYRQELRTRGLSAEQIDGAAEGKFVGEIPVVVPAYAAAAEVQEVKVELGQQVQAGQTLCLLANHHLLAVEGRAFRDESALLERVVREGWPVEIDFEEEPGHGWGDVGQAFAVTYIANTIDPDSRTFRFLLPLDNRSRTVATAGRTQTLWRFRPGQRVRLLVRVEKLDDVFVLPADAVARDGADAYVFRQNGDVFDRKPVQVVYRDRRQVVVANDGSVPPGIFVAQTAAAQLNRMVKARLEPAANGDHDHDH